MLSAIFYHEPIDAVDELVESFDQTSELPIDIRLKRMLSQHKLVDVLLDPVKALVATASVLIKTVRMLIDPVKRFIDSFKSSIDFFEAPVDAIKVLVDTLKTVPKQPLDGVEAIRHFG